MMQGYNQKNLHKKGDFINQQENFDENDQNNENGKKKSKRPCSFYRRGKCRDGDNCKFSHVDVVKFDKKKLSSNKQKKNNNDDNDNNNEQDNNNEEQNYDDNLQEGEEQNEQDNNEDNNDEDGEDNGDGEQKKNKSKKICIFFRRNNCKFGDNCKYLHIAGNYKKKSRSNRDNNAESSSTSIAHNNNNNNNNNVSNNDNNNNNDVDENNNNNVDGEAVPGASNGEDVENLKYRTKPCRFFRRGHCNSGDDCPFLHVKGRNHNNNNNNNNNSQNNNNNNNNNQNNQRKSTEPFFQSESDNRNGNEEGNHDVNYQNNNNNGDNNINNNAAADGDNQQNDDPSKYRTKQCRYFRKGKCNSGDDCKFLHSNERVVKLNSNSINDSKSSSKEHNNNNNNNNDNNNNNINNNNNNINNTTSANATTPEVLDHRIRTKPCTYFRRGHCRSGDECLFLHVSDADARAMLKGNKKSKFEGNSKSNSNNTSQLRTFTIYSSNSDKKRTKEIQFPYEDTPIPADHQEDLDPYVILVSWEIRTQEFANHATIKRGLHDIFVENLGFYETHSQTVYEAEVSSLCSLLKIPLTDNENKILPALRSRLNHLIDAGLKPNNGLYGDYNAAATWLNTMYERGCDNQLTTPKEEAASLVMYIARRSAVFG